MGVLRFPSQFPPVRFIPSRSFFRGAGARVAMGMGVQGGDTSRGWHRTAADVAWKSPQSVNPGNPRPGAPAELAHSAGEKPLARASSRQWLGWCDLGKTKRVSEAFGGKGKIISRINGILLWERAGGLLPCAARGQTFNVQRSTFNFQNKALSGCVRPCRGCAGVAAFAA